MSANFFTLQDARDFVKRFVEAGTCNTQLIDDRINEACRRLLVKADLPYTTRQLRMRTDNGCFPLPREVEKVIWVNFDNYPGRVFNQHYEFLSSGPGEINAHRPGSGIKDLVDAGLYAFMFDMPSIETLTGECCTDRTLGEGLNIIAVSDSAADTNLSVTIYGTNRLQMDLPSEDLQINQWSGGVEGQLDIGGGWSDSAVIKTSTQLYRELKAWKKPVTTGYVSLYAIEKSSNKMWFLAKAHPDDTRPMWRRYKITNRSCGGVEDCSCILMLVKLKWVKMTRADDILCVQNLDAIKQMVISLREENAGKLQDAILYEQNAERLLNAQIKEHEVAGGTPILVDWERSLMGSQYNRYNI